MGYASGVERAVLDQMEPRWQRQGYRLVRGPSRDELPAFLKGFQPDAIAVGATPPLVIEVVNPHSKATKAKVTQLSALFEDQDEWKLEVIYAPSESGEIAFSSPADIRQALKDSIGLLAIEPRAALLLAWAAFEAAGRHVHPDAAPEARTSLSLVELLVSNGDLPLGDQAALRSIARKRNAIAHGDLSTGVERSDVLRIVEACDQLLGRTLP
jgi:hypothetical protein